LPCPTIASVFAAVARGEASVGIVPIENTTEGIVTPTYDCLAATELTLCGQGQVPISHHLLSRNRELHRVRPIASHPPPLGPRRPAVGRGGRGAGPGRRAWGGGPPGGRRSGAGPGRTTPAPAPPPPRRRTAATTPRASS